MALKKFFKRNQALKDDNEALLAVNFSGSNQADQNQSRSSQQHLLGYYKDYEEYLKNIND